MDTSTSPLLMAGRFIAVSGHLFHSSAEMLLVRWQREQLIVRNVLWQCGILRSERGQEVHKRDDDLAQVAVFAAVALVIAQHTQIAGDVSEIKRERFVPGRGLISFGFISVTFSTSPNSTLQ